MHRVGVEQQLERKVIAPDETADDLRHPSRLVDASPALHAANELNAPVIP
ncbi:hypothetical protein LWC35_11415 [Pseudonocardia kujensis]|nr:hypothetical protein [Pseudonocardia kujensis]MCE0763507.1 hypothetical protein [Pseudonocardia kujensis]